MNAQKNQNTHLHFVGVGGIGMSGIAEVFVNQGYRVSGSDQAESEITDRLNKLGVKVFLGHDADHVAGANVVVISSAVKESNPEVMAARKAGIPVIPRAEMLGELMRGKHGIAVAGTHGKTTTTTMVAAILIAADLDPTIVIGGRVNSLGGSNAKLGQGGIVVAEADESDGSFLHLPAVDSIVTNVDNDHLDHFGSLEAIEEAFLSFVSKLPFYGMAAVCIDDSGIKRCMGRWKKPVRTYGFSDEAEIQARNLVLNSGSSGFEVWQRLRTDDPQGAPKKIGEIVLNVPGKHNVLNALGAITVALKLGVSFSRITEGLAAFGGVKRRFEICWKDAPKNQVIVDDYGHHPTEILATLSAARQYWPKPGRILTVFQPHRYTRTLHSREGFQTAFHEADVLWVTDIYSAGEDPIPGVTGESLADAIRSVGQPGQKIDFAGNLETARDRVLAEMRPGDLVLCLGAGTITRLPSLLISKIDGGSGA